MRWKNCNSTTGSSPSIKTNRQRKSFLRTYPPPSLINFRQSDQWSGRWECSGLLYEGFMYCTRNPGCSFRGWSSMTRSQSSLRITDWTRNHHLTVTKWLFTIENCKLWADAPSVQKNHHKLKTETWKNKACRKYRKNSIEVNLTEEKSWNWRILSTGKSLKKYRKNISTSFLAKKYSIRKQGNKNCSGIKCRERCLIAYGYLPSD